MIFLMNRAIKTSRAKTDLLTLEPFLQGKLKVHKFRFIGQFGYSIILKEGHDYMKPMLAVGMEYVL